jgi:spermidine synthase
MYRSFSPSPPQARRQWARFEWNGAWGSGIVHVLLKEQPTDRGELRRRLASDEMTQPFIFDTGVERRLHFTWDCVQGTLLRHDPAALVANYTRKMMAFLLVNPQPRSILMLGLGGGELVRFCHRHLPRADITAVEIDADVLALRGEFGIPPDDARFRIVHADGAEYVRDLCRRFDVILVDAFDRRGIAPSLASPQFHRQAASGLTDRGVLVMNFWGEKARYPASIESARRAFGASVRLVPTPSGNVVLFASRQQLPDRGNAELHLRASRLQQMLCLDFPRYLRRLCHGQTLA